MHDPCTPFYADLHLHSRYARATSRNADLPELAWSARRRGITVLGTGDFTHPAWFGELQQGLVPAEPGLSADPPMHWRASSHDRFRVVSYSDAHAPSRLGREATELDAGLDYAAIRRALAEAIGKVRGGQVVRSPGFDGQTGRSPSPREPASAPQDAAEPEVGG